jgi:recombination protein RecA
MQKNMGKAIGGVGTKLHEAERVPTGIFAFDMAVGGGWVKGRVNEIFGPESSGKTNTVLKTIATTQALFPDKYCVFIALEPFDPMWAKALGVDIDKLILMQPHFSDQVVDMVEAFVCADDVSLIALDSIGAMISENELTSAAEKQAVGGSAAMVSKMMRKVLARQQEMDHKGGAPTLLVINQIRMKIGVMMGNPEDTPGGRALKHAANLRVRVSAEDISIGAVSGDMPVHKKTHFRIKKWKCPILSASGAYEMVMVPHDGLEPGDCQDGNTVLNYLKKCGALTGSTKDGWKVFEETFPKQDDIKKKLFEDKVWGIGIRAGLIKAMLVGGEIIAPSEEETKDG